MGIIKKKWLQWVILGCAFTLLCIALYNNIYFNWRYRLITFFAALALLMFVLLVTKRFALRTLGALMMVVVACFLFYTQYMLGTIMNPIHSEKVSYQLFTLREAAFIEGDFVYGEIGQAQTRDEYIIEAYQKNDIVNPSINYYQTVSSLVLALYDRDVNSIWVDSRFMNEVTALFPDFSTRTIVSGSFEKLIEREDTTVEVDVLKDPYVVYVSGIDVYGSTNTRSRSDLNLLLIINPNTNKVLSVSIPRDTYIELSCRNQAKDKLTHAGLYGVDCSIGSIEGLLNIQINYYLRVNFTSLQTVVDGLGGVEVNSKYAFTTDSGFTYGEGLNAVDGESAVAFARERTHIPYGDVSRGANHQALLEAIFRKLIDPSKISTLPTYLSNFLNVLDTDFGYDSFSRLISHQIDNDETWSFESITLSGKGDMQYTYSQGDTYKYYVYWADEDSVRNISQRISEVLLGQDSGE